MVNYGCLVFRFRLVLGLDLKHSFGPDISEMEGNMWIWTPMRYERSAGSMKVSSVMMRTPMDSTPLRPAPQPLTPHHMTGDRSHATTRRTADKTQQILVDTRSKARNL